MQETLIKAKLSKMHSPLCTTLRSHSTSADTYRFFHSPWAGLCSLNSPISLSYSTRSYSDSPQECYVPPLTLWNQSLHVGKVENDTNEVQHKPRQNHQVTTPIAKGMISILPEKVNIHLSNGFIFDSFLFLFHCSICFLFHTCVPCV